MKVFIGKLLGRPAPEPPIVYPFLWEDTDGVIRMRRSTTKIGPNGTVLRHSRPGRPRWDMIVANADQSRLWWSEASDKDDNQAWARRLDYGVTVVMENG